MPAIRSQHMNGFADNKEIHLKRSMSKLQGSQDEMMIGAALANKKMQLIEEENHRVQTNGFHKTPQQDCEVFEESQTLGLHRHSSNQDDEPIVIFDTQNNTSISQTAKDQFAAALLRLQSGLDVSTQRLDAIETRIDDLVKQTRQQARQQQSKSESKSSWATTLVGNGKLGTLLYLSWPVLVFVALRTIERRNMLNKLA